MPWILRSAEIFSSGDGKFVAAPSMKSSRDEPTVTTLKDGKLLIVGGDSSSAEIYDPASNTFTETGAMASSRHGQAATLLRDGAVLIAGGGFEKLEVYDPATESSSSPASSVTIGCITPRRCSMTASF